MHFPSTMIGDVPVKNWGQAIESFRHTTLPSAAFRQESTPPTPRVHNLPPATAGELRGPGCPPPTKAAAPVTATAAYLSFQSSLPLFASRHSVTSSSPCRVKT